MATKYTITLSASSWISTGGVPSKIYLSGGAFYIDTNLTEQIGSLGGYTRSGYRFTGFYSASSGGTQYTNEYGSFTSAAYALTANKTWYAQGEKLSCSILLNANNGSGGTDSVYIKTGTADGEQIYYTDINCTTPITPSAPTRSGYVFLGFYSATTGGTKYINADMTPTDALRSRTTDGTVYAQWQAPYKVTLSGSGWTGATAAFWYDAIGGRCYTAADMATETTSVAVPTKECQRFTGYNTASGGTGTSYIDAEGNISPDIGEYVTAAKTLYAQGVVVSYKITPAQASGTGGEGVFYAAAGETGAGRFHTDDQCTSAAKTTAAVPTRTGYTFLGYYSAASGGTQYIDAAGAFTEAFYSAAISAATTITAHWQANQYTLTFDFNGGTGSPASKTVTFGSAIGTLPSPTSPKGTFLRWSIDGTAITSTTVWNIGADARARAEWDLIMGKVVDYFSLGSATLVPISSSSGDGKKRTCAANATWSGSTQNGGAGRFSSGVNDIGGIWRNPTVTYQVVGNMTLSLNLGKAYAATKSGSTMTISGWMITSVRVRTQVGKFPTVTVTGTANEGADAINKFAVSIPIQARARAQDLLSAITGGGALQTCEAAATCTPVVCAENNMPCASDVVQGRYTVKGTTYAPGNESAPTAGTGFTSIGEPKTNGDKEYPMWEITVEKEIV